MIATKECTICYKLHNETISKGCRICDEFKFPESILCELTRAAQEGETLFECCAFKPRLSIVTDGAHDTSGAQKPHHSPHRDFSDKIKWLNAYAQQQLQRDSNHIGYKLRYHLCLITRKRNRLFSDRERFSERITDLFCEVGKHFQGTSHLLGLGSDHLHIYIDSSPDFSLDEIGNLMLDASEDGLCKLLPELVEKDGSIFERSYFVETIG